MSAVKWLLPFAWLAGAWLAVPAVQAAPDLRRAEMLNGLVIYPDSRQTNRYYYGPGDVHLVVDDDGRPDIHLLSSRYVGTAAAGDQGRYDQRNLLSFRVRLDQPSTATLRAIKATLQNRHRRRPDLRPLPIQRMPTRLVHVPADDSPATAHVLPRASMDSETRADGHWHERSYHLRLNAADAQLLIDAMQRGAVLLSLAWAFVADGLGMEVALEEITGSPELLALIEQEETDHDQQVAMHVVKAGATPIELDAGRWPELLQQIDINERLPPGFGVLDVRCYDFQTTAGAELFEKRVDIEAETVTGSRIIRSLLFSSLEPDRFSSQLRFPVAVRLDRPYRYRVEAIAMDGSVTTEVPWTQRETWTALLDVSRSAERHEHVIATTDTNDPLSNHLFSEYHP